MPISLRCIAAALACALFASPAAAQPATPHNIILFVPERCTVEIADSTLQQGQGMHGGFSRGDTANFMAAYGPDFKQSFADPAPVSNADVGMTVAKLLGLHIPAKGTLIGRPMDEALRGGNVPAYRRNELRSAAGPSGIVTVLKMQLVGTTKYFDVAGFPGRRVGL